MLNHEEWSIDIGVHKCVDGALGKDLFLMINVPSQSLDLGTHFVHLPHQFGAGRAEWTCPTTATTIDYKLTFRDLKFFDEQFADALQVFGPCNQVCCGGGESRIAEDADTSLISCCCSGC